METPITKVRFYLIGIVFGLTLGPFYLVLNVVAAVRTSEKWAKICVGGNVGLAYLIFVALLWNETVYMPVLPWDDGLILVSTFLSGAIFVFSYGTSVILTEIVRSTRTERRHWKYYVMGGLLGLLFGPFGFLFLRIFPENPSKTSLQS